MMTEMEIRYTTDEVAKMYHVAPSTVQRWVRTGRLGAISLGGAKGPYLFRPRDLAAFERAGETLTLLPREA